ncbi:hypothetical protein Poli38472_011851 [Pythium oligandrum]|uniref:Uncharacterized protein n=1 Tax=Pythium oligandrum TaxID=41045 RepID=A0A8K1C8A8_PYTOL|nr:hypothetical protein Poli38472_011851 [Pythium oligandrum]|eukprot:TMW58263.1 hypothetical protein Poli38472_011851 [Pythium oligandrum]
MSQVPWNDLELLEFSDDDAILQAALAFVDEAQPLPLLSDTVAASRLALLDNPGNNQERVSASSCHQEPRANTAAPPVSEKRKRPPSQCVKDELDYLRATVNDLEEQLETLLHPSEPDVVDEMWKRVAARQSEERERAQNENKRLLAILEEQIRAGKRLERLLLAQEGQVHPALPAKRLCTHHSMSPLDDPALESQLMDRLLVMYHDTDRILANPRFQSVSVDRINSVEIQNGAVGPQLEALETRMIPFDFQATADAMWEISKEQAYPTRVILHQDVKADEGIITRLFERSVELPSGPSHYRARTTRRRFVEANRVVMVSSLVMDALQVAGNILHGVCIRTHMWAVLQPAAEVGVACGPQRPATIRRTYYLVEPEVYDDSLSDEDRRSSVGILSNFVLNSVRFKTDFNYQKLENHLLDRLRGLQIENTT